MKTLQRRRRLGHLFPYASLAVLLAATVLTSPAVAQQTGSAKGGIEDLLPVGTMIFEPRYLHPREVYTILTSLIQCERINASESRIFVRFRDASDADRARKIIQKLDIAPRRVEVILRLVVASDAGLPQYDTVEDKALLNQLGSAFRFSHYQMLGRSQLIVDSGKMGEIQFGTGKVHGGFLQLEYVDISRDKKELRANAGGRATFSVDFIDEGKGIIRLKDLCIWQQYHGGEKGGSRILNTSLNIKNGDTVVLGGGDTATRDAALIVVVTAKTLD